MTTARPAPPDGVSRRGFLARAGALAVAVAFVDDDGARAAAAGSWTPNAWLTIDARGYVTILSAPAEMGQGTMTGLPACLAEELDADWSRVRILQSPAIPRLYGNPMLRMEMSTHGDFATQGYFQPLRLVGAQTRQVLLWNAARIWGVPVGELRTEPGVVVHERTRRRLGYGQIARRATIPDPLPVVGVADLKPRSAWRLIGQPLPRRDLPSKVDGSAVYGIDVQRPGMAYGAILYPPVPHERALRIDASAALRMPGVLKVFALDGFVGILGESVEATTRAKAAIEVEWSSTAAARRYDSAAVHADYQRIAADPQQAGVTMAQRGDVAAALGGAASIWSAEYHSEHLAHMQMEPMNATALCQDGRVEIWLSTQSPTHALQACARAAGIDEAQVTLHSTLLGGGFGRLSDDADNAYEAVRLARELPGRPVKFLRSREDDVLNDKFRPLGVQRIDVALDAERRVLGMRHRLVSASAYARSNPQLLAALKGVDYVSGLGGDTLYGWPHHLSQFVAAERGWDVGPWRGISFGYTVFAIESSIDELAALRGAEPLSYRLDLLQAQPRAQQVLRAAAAMAEWNRERGAGRALGLAFSYMSNSYAAGIAELSLDASGVAHVHRFWVAIDAGTVVNPVSVTTQVEGGVVMGLGAALVEQVEVRAGELQQGNFGAYAVPRMSQVPEEIAVQLVASEAPPAGVGEIAVTLVAPAVGNAIARLTGRRLRALPMSPERVRAAGNA